MAAGFTLLVTVIVGICSICAFISIVYSTIRKTWREKDTPTILFILITMTCTFYCISLFMSFGFYISISLSEDILSNNCSHPICRLAVYGFLLFYLLSHLLNILLWIKRLEITFQSSIYALPKWKIKALKFNLFLIIIDGALILIINGVIKNQSEFWRTFSKYCSILWSLLFIVQLGALTAAFIAKLIQLRKVAETDIIAQNINVKSPDPESIQAVKELIALQLKLTILAITNIFSTFTAIIFTTVILRGYFAIFSLAIDAFLSFICVFCVVNKHEFIFNKSCFICIKVGHLYLDQELYELENISKDSDEITARNTNGVDIEMGNIEVNLPSINSDKTNNFNVNTINDFNDFNPEEDESPQTISPVINLPKTAPSLHTVPTDSFVDIVPI